jgi:hypothetical protein
MALAPQGKQPQAKAKAKGKAKGGASSKAAAGPSGASGSGQAGSSQGSGRPSAPPTSVIGLNTEVQAALPAAAEASCSSQQPAPQPVGGSSTKADKEKARKERQRQRYTEDARHALYEAIHRVEDTASLDAECVRAAEEAMQQAAKYETRCEALAALVEFARTMIEQARAAEAERAREDAEAAAAAAEAAEAAEAAAAAERLRMEEQAAVLTRTVQSASLQLQQLQAQLGVVAPAAPSPQMEAEGALCVVCMDAPKQHIIFPCGHQCVCEACAQQLTQATAPTCPVCRALIQATTRVYLV